MMKFNCLTPNVKFWFTLAVSLFFTPSFVSAQCNLTISPNTSSYGCYTTLEDVVWSSAVNATISGNDLNKSAGGNAWNAGAFSTAPVYNNGYVETVASEVNTNRFIGLSNTNPDAGNASILFAVYLKSNATLEVYESNVSRGVYGSYNSGDTIRISVERGRVKYFKNSTQLFISNATPTLPLFVDVSLNTTTATLKKVVIGNLSNGLFKATATTLGTGPAYQWKLNGTNVGTNISTYNNTSLALNDMVTCVLTPGTGGCSASPVTSNNVKIKIATTYKFGDFYITTTPAASGCSQAVAQVVWDSLSTNLNVSGNSLTRIQTSGWDGGAASLNTVSNNGYFQFTALETNNLRAAGLSTTNVNSNFNTIQYAFYLNTAGGLQVYETGLNKGTFGTYTTGDLLKIAVEANVVKYYQNGNLLYISTVAPTLPLLVDVSINSLGGTISNALVSNYTSGVFNAVATSAGASPAYQWKLNGANAGTGATYNNTSLVSNDVVSCVLTPSLNGCSTSSYPSNTISYKTNAPSANIEFYIQGTAVATACVAVEEQVKWKTSDLLNLQASSNNLSKIQSGGIWDGGAASWNTVSNNGYFQFTATETNTSRVVGLSSSNANASNTTIQFGFYLLNTGVLQVIESNANKGTFGSYASSDVFKIAVESSVVKYYKNGTLLYISANAPTLPMLVDVSINTLTGTVTNALVGNYNTGGFTAVATNSGVAPIYQWLLNGAPTGTNSSTYTNASLVANDVVTCLLTPDLIGCTTVAYTSNSLTNKTISSPANLEFYIQGTPATSACFSGEEQVRWKISDLNYVIPTGNNLSKFQSNGNWDGGAASWNTVANNGYFQFTATETNTLRAAGLSTTNTSAHFNTIQYAFYLTSAGSVQIYESNTNRGTFGTYIGGDIFKISIESSVVKYYQNGNLLYISTNAPTLPMLVDVSINTVGGTITSALIGNYSSGTYTATALNAGPSLTYQWQINGSNVGVNSTTYTNTALLAGDVVTCIVSPNIVGCSATAISSNNIVNKTITVSSSIEFYIQDIVSPSACLSGEEQVKWKNADLNFVQANNNNLLKIQSDGNWDGGAASWNTVSNNGYFQFTATETNKYRMAGLSTTNANANYTSIQYAFYLLNTGSLQIYESGTSRGTFGTYSNGDLFKIMVDNNIVKYYQNATLVYTSLIIPTLPLIVDVSIYNAGGTITNAITGNYTVGSFGATAINAGASPSYQWQLNGLNVGANSATYTNLSLVNNDQITCILTPALPGCNASVTFNSNTIINKTLPAPSSIDVYIQGTVPSSACRTAEEQVKWKTSDFNFVSITSGNNLSKVQSNNNWDGGAASWNTVSDNGYFQFTASETNLLRVVGLSTTNSSTNNTSIQYAYYLSSTGGLQITESGTNRGTFGSYTTGDLLAIRIEASVVKYYQNNILLYISTITPTLPMLVDVSIYHTGGTINNAVIGNYSAGTFTASATNAGPSPSYQWKLNGANVGTNISSYTNTGLAVNDVLTCLVSPDLGGCNSVQYLSNSITNKPLSTFSNIEFYVQGTSAVSACNVAEEEAVWKLSDLNNVQVAGTVITKIQSDGNWDGGAASWNSLYNNGYIQFTAAETNKARMIGLSTTNANSNYTTIQYAVYLQNNGTVSIYENGNNLANIGSYANNDIFKISVDNNVVKYYQNTVLIYTSTVPPTLPLLVDVSIKHVGGTVSNLIVANYNTGVFTATTANAGVAPTYQWKLNGSNVGTNSTTYSNTSLSNNDVLTCVLTPNFPGCTGIQYTSNSVTNKSIAFPSSLEFYIQGAVATSACRIGEEQVRWKNADYNFVTGSGNNLIKVQSNGIWDGGAASWNMVQDNGYFQFTASETNLSRMAGLSTTNTNANYTSIQYAFYLVNTGGLQIYESGTYRGAFGTYTTNDLFRISVESGIVKYYQNGNLLYISTVPPVLPMLVDVSINHLNGTVTNALVGNYNTGSFNATALGAGVTPSYQWKLNGANVGTNVTTYTNATLSINDVISCVLTPGIPGCSGSSYASNTITSKSVSTGSSIEFYIQGTPSLSSCLAAEEQVRWKISDLTNVQSAGNNLTKVQSNGWDGGAASWNTVSNNGYFKFIASETTSARMVGLSTTNADANYTSIQYAFYLLNTGSLQILESGTSKGTFGVYNTNDTLQVSVEASVVKYYQNGNLLYISTVAPTLPMLVDVSIRSVGGTINNSIVGNNNIGAFTGVSTNAGVSPAYQWKLNGANVGTNSSTYTNSSLSVNDNITCVLTPNLSGCAASIYNSNSITNKFINKPVAIDFYIQGTAAISACNTADEQVRWRTTDLSNLKATGNSLTKIQSGGNWDGGAASFNTVSNNGYFQFTATELTTARMVGLSSTNADDNYTSIQYAFYLTSTGSLQIYESGTNRGAFSTYLTNDILKISVELNLVKYYQNGNLLYISNVAPTMPLLVDVSINSTAGTISNAIVSNFNTGLFTATATNVGVSPVYQWKLNGANVGTNSSSYTNTSLASNDVVSCTLVPNLAGCAGNAYTSNLITNKPVTAPVSIDFYVSGTAVSTACNLLTEQVQWKTSDFTNLSSSTNNLTKLQSNNNWNGGAASWNTVSNNGYLQFNLGESNNYKSVGLSNTNADNNYTSIQYGYYLTNTGTVQIVESGANRGTFSSYNSSDTLKIAVESNVVKYYLNTTLLYVSAVVPVLPLLVDVSIYSSNATVKNVTVTNYNAGTFTANATNAGVSPVYQWQLNGANVGTNSATYTNASLANNDIVTCVLKPNLGGCSTAAYISNATTVKTAPIPANVAFYIQANVGSSTCNSIAEEQVKWKIVDLTSNMTASTNNLNKIQSNGIWNGGAASWNTVSNNGYFQFTTQETITAKMAGLSTTNVDANYTSIQYAIFLTNGGSLQIYESGSYRGTFSTYIAGDVFKVAIESNVVKYYKNNVLLYISGVVPTLPLLVDVSINNTSGTISNALVGNYTTNTFTASSINAGATPAYQWKLNGTNVGTNSATYTNTALAAADQVSCALSTNAAGCGSLTYTSNIIIEKLAPVPSNLDFYIKGTAVISSCNLGEEQVKWENSDLSSNTQATSNNLFKTASSNIWDGGAASWNTVSNNGFLQFTTNENNRSKVIGLSTTNIDANFTSIQFGIFLTNGGGVQVVESGTNRGSFGSYASNDLFKVSVETNIVKYYKNGTVFYTSGVLPTLPLLVDASLYSIGATINNALVSNYNSGTFTAGASNAGATPSYQWQLNGTNVGTNSTTYTNGSLNVSDIVTCVLTPNIAGCALPLVYSNAITVKSTASPAPIEFYIQGVAVAAACNVGEEQVRWKTSDLLNVTATGNNLNKITSNGNWNGGAASWNAVSNNGYLQFTASETNKYRMVGLSNTNVDANYTSIQYAIYLVAGGSVNIYESGSNRGSFASYVTNDVFRISIESSVVKYYKNGNLLYISTVAPTFPLLADASIYNTGGTVTNAVIGNLNAGSFTATSTNSGTTPVYQWKVNGINTSTGTTYSNTALAANDIVTCVLTPDLGLCSITTYPSNSITNKTINKSNGIDFYIKGTVATSACNTGEEQVTWKTSDLNNVQATGNNLIKIQSNGNWDGGAASWNTVSNNGYFQFTATETNKHRMAGLSTTNPDADYTTIQYAIYLLNSSTVQIYESGNYRGSFGTYATGDVFKISVEASVVKYYQNNVLIYISAIAPALPMLVDVSILHSGGTISNAIVSNYNTGVFTATTVGAGGSPVYQWKLNGANVGTNSMTYTNTALTNNDVVNCLLTPALGGCATTTYTSNTITTKRLTAPTSIDFYIQGVVTTSACNTAEEQVQWKISDLSNVQANSNNLNKIQSNSNWDGGAASWNTVSNNGYFQFTATEINKYRAVGLSTTNANANYTSIQYAFYLLSNGTVQIQESGNYRGSFGTYAANDLFKVAVEASVVKYYKNNVLLYISAVVPTLPMLVDVSIYNIGGTVTNAIVSNYNAGSFMATATNAGASPVYQWKVNAANVGTNTNTYTNTALNPNDIVTCILTPNLGGCNTTMYASNTITQKVITNPTNLDFYIQGVVASSGCATADEQVKWKISDLSNVQASGNNLSKIQSNGNWDGGAASWNTVSNNGYFQFTATETNQARMAGLSTTNANSDYATIQYAIYLQRNSNVSIYEAGTNRGTKSTYVSGDVFSIAIESGVVKYYQNGNLLYISTTAPSLPLLVDVSINDVGGTITNAIVSNYNTGSFTATSINAGVSPTYQWKLNGTNVGVNSNSYSNSALSANDVITCVLNPSLAGCVATTYTSNSITNKQLAAPNNLDFYIQGAAASSACNTADEQVKWKVSDLNFVVASGNNLTKVQSNGNWDGGAASWNRVSNNGYFQFTASETTTSRMIGLSTTNVDANYTSIQYGFNLASNSALNIYELGTSRGSFGNYATSDILQISVEANVVKYYKNGSLLYISTIVPVLPLLVDVSIATVGGTISNAIVSNYNTGTFTAASVNSGTSPVYQWKLNGTNVGTNSTTYINTTLASNDIITCALTPNLGGCTTSMYNSNSIIYKPLSSPPNIDFYLQATPVSSSCATAEEQVRWKISDLANVQAIGNNLNKIQSNGNWDGGAASWNTVSNNGYFQFTVTEINKSRVIGLSTTNANSNYTSIQYSFYLASTSLLQIIESGVGRGSFGSYTTNDVLKIAVQSNVVKYYKNGLLIYTSAVVPTLPMLVDVSIASVGGTVSNAIVSNINNGVFTATAIGAGSSPNYQWKLNGANVGTNSMTYSNASLINNDVVMCVLTPSLSGCTASAYNSNTAINRVTSITTQPLSQSICVGSNATLSVVASGSSLNYQWRRNGVNIIGATSSSYTIVAAAAANAGNYDVIVNTGGCTSNTAVVSVSTVNQWIGGTSSAWANVANWSCGSLPNSATDVIVPSAALNMPLITTAVNVYSISINTSGSLTNTAGTLSVYGNWVNNGVYTDNGTTAFLGATAQSITGATNFKNLTLNNPSGLALNNASTVNGVLTLTNGTFTTNNNLNVDLYNGGISGTGAGTTTGNIRFFKLIWSNRYHYISSPIPGRTAADWNDNVTINFGANTNMYYYNETVPDTSIKVGWTGAASLSQPLQTMTGYALYFRATPTTVLDVAGPYTHNLGTLNSGTLTNTKSTNPTFKPASDGWNHMGNPYPSTIDWSAASGWTKTGLDNAIYYWDPRNNRFSAYVAGIGTNGATRYIGSMQGFFVKVTTSGGTGSLSMNNAVRTTAVNTDVWRTASDGSVLRLTATSGASSDETVVRLQDEASTSFDSESDAYKMMNEGQTPSIYTEYNTDRYAINTLPSSASNETIPVNLDAKFAGPYTFSADVTGFEEADSLIFVDKLTNTRQDLRVNPTYSCDLVKKDYRDRFYIQYNKKASVVTDNKTTLISSITVFSFEQKVTVNFNNAKVSTADISIYDVKGNAVYKVKSQSITSDKVEINLPFVSSGVYIVRIESGQVSKTQEVYIAK